MGINILAVDDSKVMRFMINNVLSGAGHTVSLACDGKEGAIMAAEKIFDLVITDVNMPEIDGIEFATILRKDCDYSTIPIIFLTSESAESFPEESDLIGAAAWIVKPFSPVKLLEIVNGVIATGSAPDISAPE